MYIFNYALLFSCMCFYSILDVKAHTISDETNQHHVNTSFANILNSWNLSTLHLEGLQSVLGGIGFVNCSQSPSKDCNKCLTAEQLMKLHGLNTSGEINQTAFDELAPSIVFHMLPLLVNTTCTELNTTGFRTRDVYDRIANNYNNSEVNGEVLDHVLEDINSTMAALFNKIPCFSAGDVFVTLGIVEEEDDHEADLHENLTHAQLQFASANIIDHLVSGYCIKESEHHEEHNDDLPDKIYFISKLFDKYGVNGVIKEDKFESLFEVLGIVKQGDEEEEHDHDHRRRRDIDAFTFSSSKRSRKTRSADDGNSQDQFAKCYSADQIMKIFEVGKNEGIEKDKFQEMCPAMIQQLESKLCSQSDVEPTVLQHIDNLKLKVWGYGILSVTIISSLSLAGAFAIPCFGKATYDNLMTYFMALAVGTLCGDGLIHLFPHSLGIHDHQDHVESSQKEIDQELGIIWKSMTVAAAIYAFYIFEFLMKFLVRCTSKGHSHGHSHGQGLTVITNPSNTERDQDMLTCMAQPHPSPDQIVEKLPPKPINSLGVMIIIGDTLHNIIDGVAIGVAFSEIEKSGLSGGISTSIAIFCHELPHELGDFAVLVSTGMSVKRALLFNFLSACSCYIGLFIGIGLGEIDTVRLWIFAITAGMFVYVSLVTVLPEMMRNKAIKTAPLRVFVLQNLGLLTGFAIMSMLAIYEKDIVI